ncbi:MAG: hypothetical protein JNL97_07965 [Verrucomicrobiales bacterium]|nr:hypothetical protein [Verrucomicrobiales bacterium]
MAASSLPAKLGRLLMASPTLAGLLAVFPLSAATPSSHPIPQKTASDHLHNLFRATPRILSGSSPEDDAAFAELERLGVGTIVSVDGARPDVEAARRHGIRYIHLPIGYDGISAERQAQLAAAARSIPGSIYVHCHHGRHRGPAAAALLCQTTEGWSHRQATDWLKLAGTSPDYPGLYRSVNAFTPALRSDPLPRPDLPEISPPSTTVDAMVQLDDRMSYLESSKRLNWKPVPSHPDLDPKQVAMLVLEHYRELLRTPETARQTEGFREDLRRSEATARRLREALDASPIDPTVAASALADLSRACKTCHATHRDRPRNDSAPTRP